MTTVRCQRWAGVIVLTVLCTAGCNPFTMPFFMLWGLDPKIDPEFSLANSKKETRLVILTYSPLELRPELAGADRELTALLGQQIQETAKRNKERISVVPEGKLRRFKDEHPNWKALNPEEIGKYFDADYVIDVEIEALSLFEQGSGNQLFRGRAELSVNVIDPTKAGEEPVFRKQYACEYPRTRGPIPASDSNPAKFRLEFLTRVATDVSWLFTAHTVENDFPCD